MPFKFDNNPSIVGGGGSGVNDYELLSNLPEINGTVLIDNNTSEELGLVSNTENQGISGKKTFDDIVIKNNELFIGDGTGSDVTINLKVNNITAEAISLDYTSNEAIMAIGSSMSKTMLRGEELLDSNKNTILTNANIPIDNQLIQFNKENKLTVNLNEVGSELVDKLNTDVSNISEIGKQKIKDIVGTSPVTSDSNYGIKGDYSTHYGILDAPNGLITNTTGKNIKIHAGIILQCAGQDIKSTIASEQIIECQSTSDFVLFYTSGGFLECGDVFYQEEEPENGTSNYIAWYNPNIETNPDKMWKFKSNDTGNVFREAVGTPLANIKITGDNITRIDFIGYRILDDEIFVEKDDIATIGRLGIVKPDGTSITITNDGTISSVGGGGTDVNFIPADTILTVKTDSSGQFTKLSEAINYLTGKWSNGTVTIQLGEGDFVEETTIDIPEFNIKTLQIIGQGVDKTSISCSDTREYNYIITNRVTNIRIANLVLKGDITYKLRGLYANLNGSYLLEDVNLYNFERGSMFIDGARAYLKGTLNIGSTSTTKVVDTGVQSINGGMILMQSEAKIHFNKCDGALYCNGGIISTYPNVQVTYSGVTTPQIQIKGGLFLGGLN